MIYFQGFRMRNLFLEYWHSSSEERNKEVQDCIISNIKSGLFNNIFIYTEKQENFEIFKSYSNTVKPIISPLRCTFYVAFYSLNNFITTNDLNPEHVINVVTNADIEFNNTLTLADNIGNNDFYALTRYEKENECWELHKNKDLYKGSDSQDSWIYRGLFNLASSFDFPFGVPGCDNKLAYEVFHNQYNLLNPSYDIKALHRHQTNLRPGSSSDIKERLLGPYYLITPTKLNDSNSNTKE